MNIRLAWKRWWTDEGTVAPEETYPRAGWTDGKYASAYQNGLIGGYGPKPLSGPRDLLSEGSAITVQSPSDFISHYVGPSGSLVDERVYLALSGSVMDARTLALYGDFSGDRYSMEPRSNTDMESLVAGVMDMMYGQHSGKVVGACDHCGQWNARFCPCRHCGAPVN